ncbi:MAG TPA: hypothetical protein VFZ21_02635 [Gemmatimonadaceae bacterium]|jgi:hypothetical protein|nr:hypothetical protein [Gemmatimonadaceae bacterium]
MMASRRRVAGVGAALTLGMAACGSTEPGSTERWAADLVATGQVLIMTFRGYGSEVSGTATLASLTNPGGEALTLTGTRSDDSLKIMFRRQDADAFRFRGRYAGPGLAGVLDGAEFVELPVAFRAR